MEREIRRNSDTSASITSQAWNETIQQYNININQKREMEREMRRDLDTSASITSQTWSEKRK